MAQDLIGLAQARSKFLPADQAFVLQVNPIEDNQLQIQWSIAPEYYLYKDKLQVEVFPEQQKNSSIIQMDQQATRVIDDPYFGKQDVYENIVDFFVPLNKLKTQYPKAMTIHYQGCAAQGLCYPPKSSSFKFHWRDGILVGISPINSVESAHAPHETETAKTSEISAEDVPYFNASFIQTLFTFLGLGILLSFTPCVLPMLPILSSVIVGQKQRSYFKGFTLSLTYTLSMSLVLALLGALAVLLGKNLSALFQHPVIISLFASLFIYLGLVQLGIGKLSLPNTVQNRLHQWQSNLPAGSYVNAFVMGALATLIASPCVSAPLVGALSYMAQTGNYVLGMTTLFCLGLGMGLVLIIAGTLGNHLLPRTGNWMHIINKIFACMLFALSIWLLGRFVSETTYALLWAAWCCIAASFLGTFSNIKQLPSRLGMLLLLPALLLASFVIQKEPYPIQRLSAFVQLEPMQVTSVELSYHKLESIDDLTHYLKSNESKNKPTLLKAHATWCTTCKHNEKVIFEQSEVIEGLKNWQLLMIDMTKMTPAKQSLAKHLKIYGPPALLFFDQNGNEEKQDRLIGKSNLNEFMHTLNKYERSNKHKKEVLAN